MGRRPKNTILTVNPTPVQLGRGLNQWEKMEHRAHQLKQGSRNEHPMLWVRPPKVSWADE
ncbi:hypothetical protein HAX54_007858, partial [Datura stramonium]|nr:hypothetical protein [Datura stramonium]